MQLSVQGVEALARMLCSLLQQLRRAGNTLGFGVRRSEFYSRLHL